MLRALRIPTEKLKDKEIASVKERLTCLAWELGHTPPLGEIKSALAAGFAETLGVAFSPAPLTPEETHLLGTKRQRFQSREWVYGLRRPLADRCELRGLYKAPGGLIRASLAVDLPVRRIRVALLTGDFFCYPRRAVFDLEARLKGVLAEPKAVHRVVEEFFASQDVRMPGVAPDDFVHALHDALGKLAFTRLSVELPEANYLFSVVKPLAEVPRPSHLLLPYCAKPPECDYRTQEGCSRCGLCHVGEAYELAETHELIPITIQNYEMLEKVLADCRRRGARSFVGSCCEAFYAKHRADFERIGLPGVLIDLDSSTCYDLGQEQRAYRGLYENQTALRIELIRKVLAGLIEGTA